MKGEQVIGKVLACVYSALGLLAVRSIYISNLGFLLAMPVRKGLKAWLMYRTCVARAIPCICLPTKWYFWLCTSPEQCLSTNKY